MHLRTGESFLDSSLIITHLIYCYKLDFHTKLCIFEASVTCLDHTIRYTHDPAIPFVRKYLNNICGRQFRRPSASELSDLACFLVLATGTILLGRTGVVKSSSFA
jgi:hypothetical protein